VQLSDNEGNSYTCSPINIPTSGSGLARTVTCTMIYTKIQVVHLDVHYAPSGSHFPAADVNDYEINVVKGDGAETKILADSGTGYPNKPYSLLAQVVPLTGTGIPTGNLIFTMQGKTGTLCNKVLDSNGLATCDITLTASDLGNHVIVMRYISSDPVKFYDSDKNVNLVIVPYPTAITVTAIQPSSPMVGLPTRFDFTVSPLVPPPSGAPTGKVTVSGGGVSCSGDLDSLGKGSCSVNFSSAGTFDITVTYPGDGTFASSTYTLSLGVTAVCPSANGFAFGASSNVPNSLQFNIGSVSGAGNLTISEVDVTWNNSPVAKLQQIRFGSNVNTTACDPTSGTGNCLWSFGASGGLDSAYPNPVAVTGLNSTFSGLNAGDTKTMLLAFNAALPPGSYSILVKFSNSCQVSISQTN
jgi:hypothetical protein